ncbi:MAG: LPS-assembly protein LptD [Prevotella sp.]|nr:LPS-assembly protein LptD [Prevotella sp.]
MACTTSTLPPGKIPEVVQSGRVVSLPEIKTPSIAADSVTLPALLDSISGSQEKGDDSLTDTEVPQDTIVPPGAEAAIKIKRDTTTMDSIELAIYKHNKAVDDSLARDSINKRRKNGIDAPVEYSADDSLTYDASNATAHLYGNSKVKYTNMDLASENIHMNLDSNVVYATGKMDSTTQQLTGTPVFKMGSDQYEQTEMMFNFKTKKGFITDVYTQQEDGYLTSEHSKRGADGEMFLEHGRYTTCDDPHPDFYIAMSRAKVRPGKDVVFGPAYLVVADVPLPLAIPYGFFPFTKSYSSGFIMPTYGDETSRGFYLRDGGYYFAVSDKMDLKLLGEIYTKGSWGLSAASNYRKRYKYNGSFYFNYQNTINGEKNMPDYSKTTSFKLQWRHSQDAKANPYKTLTASVNYASQSFEQNNLTSMYNPQAMTQTTRTSSINWSTRFSSIGLSLSMQADVAQNMRDSILEMTLPNMSISLARFYPFKRKKAAGKERWYEKINMSYTGTFNNRIKTKESQLLHSSFTKDWQNNMRHSIPIQASFTAFGYLSINPSFTLTDQTSFIKQSKRWDEANQQEITDTISGFYNVYNWDMSVSLSTKLYGYWIPNRKLFGDKIDQIRHVITPKVSFSYHPDFGASRYGYYETYQKTDADGNVSLVEYSPYNVGGVSAPSKGISGSINVDIGNNLEMKMRNKDDSLKKISLIDELGFSMSYNMAAKVRPWSDLNTRLRLKLSKRYTFNLNAVFASYVYEADSVGATPRISEHTTYWGQGKIGRFQGITQSLSYTLDNQKLTNLFKRLRGEKVDKDNDKDDKDKEDDDEWDNGVETNIDKEMERGKHGAKAKVKADTDEDGYMAFSLPFSLSIGYSISMREGNTNFNYERMRYPYVFNQNLNVSGNLRLSEGWNINFSSGYDFDNKKISMTVASLSRDLHCFNMSCQVTLFPYTSYNFSFRCNAATLTDALKYDKRSGYTNAVQWY